MERLRLSDGTTWADPTGAEYKDLAWRCIHAQHTLTPQELMQIAEFMESYEMLITHPAFTLKKVAAKIRMIREAIKKKTV